MEEVGHAHIATHLRVKQPHPDTMCLTLEEV